MWLVKIMNRIVLKLFHINNKVKYKIKKKSKILDKKNRLKQKKLKNKK